MGQNGIAIAVRDVVESNVLDRDGQGLVITRIPVAGQRQKSSLSCIQCDNNIRTSHIQRDRVVLRAPCVGFLSQPC
jgi:hypothetical protein